MATLTKQAMEARRIISDHVDANEAMTKHPTMQEILADSFGGVMYDLANRNKYNTVELLAMWDSLTASEKEACGGIVKGAINFIQGK